MKMLIISTPLVVKKFFGPVVCCLTMAALLSCSSPRRFLAPEQLPDDRRPIPEPKGKKISIIGDNVDKLITRQIGVVFDLAQHMRKISGKPKQAYNVDAFGQVSNSSWFTNRNAYRRMTLEEIARGPNVGDGPDTTGTWEIIRAKAEGVTPGFTIQDSHGQGYVIKFDPKGYREMATGAEIVSTKLIYAAGYNTPENYIVYFHPGILKMGEKVKFTDKKGRKRFMTDSDLQELLDRIEYLPDGRIRAVASKYLSGKLKGPFRYESTIDDDPNDYIPHQHRRELRGLRVLAAWLNHFDTKANNTLDVYVDEGYVKHYLIDFGSTLGSQGDEPMPPYIGFEGSFDLIQIFKQMLTLGFYIRPWEEQEPIRYPSIGRFHSRDFHPQKYKFILPNPAFQSLTSRDGYWGAKLVMSFTDEQIETAIAQGQYSDPDAAAYLLRTLIERRDIIGQYWFNRVVPVDKFKLRRRFAGIQELCFVDMAVESGLELAEEAQYRYSLTVLPQDAVISEYRHIGNSTCFQLPSVKKIAAQISETHLSTSLEWQLEVALQIKRGREGNWSKWVKVYLDLDKVKDEYVLLGITRQE
jgi:hypothetical protein